MSLSFSSSSSRHSSALVASEALVMSLRSTFLQFCNLRSAVEQSVPIQGGGGAAGQLAATLSSLPSPMFNGVNEEQIGGLIGTLKEEPDLRQVLDISNNLFQSDWYSLGGSSLADLMHAARPVGPAARFFAAQETKPLLDWEVVAGDGEVITPLPPDPPQVNMNAYRLIEVAALGYYLRPEAPERLILVPGFTGTGKTDHLIPHLISASKTRGLNPLYIDLMDKNTGMGMLKRFMRSPTHPILILDELCLLSRSDEGKLRNSMKAYLQGHEDRQLVLVYGGTHYSTQGQLIMLRDISRDLVSAERTTVVPIDVKPLNRLQAEEVLNSDARLTSEDRRRFTNFVLERLPSYLRVLRKFRLPRGVDTLEHALLNFQWVWEEDLEKIMARACVRPCGATESEAVTPELQDVGRRLEEDAKTILKDA